MSIWNYRMIKQKRGPKETLYLLIKIFSEAQVNSHDRITSCVLIQCVRCAFGRNELCARIKCIGPFEMYLFIHLARLRVKNGIKCRAVSMRTASTFAGWVCSQGWIKNSAGHKTWCKLYTEQSNVLGLVWLYWFSAAVFLTAYANAALVLIFILIVWKGPHSMTKCHLF